MTPSENGSDAVEYERIISLFTKENSREMHERHISAIDRLCKGNTTGVAIRDLPKVQKILELTLQLIRNGLHNFVEPCCALLRVLSKPYVKRSSTDEFKMPGHIVSMLAAVGEVFSPGFPRVLQMVAAEMLLCFSTAQSSRPSVLELEASKRVVDAGSAQRQYHMNQELLAHSGVISAAIRGLATAILGADHEIMSFLVRLLLNCSYLESNCKALLEAGILACLPHLLAVGFKHELAPPSIELLWNLVEFAPSEVKSSLTQPQPLLTRLLRGHAMAQPEHDQKSEEEQASRPGSATASGTVFPDSAGPNLSVRTPSPRPSPRAKGTAEGTASQIVSPRPGAPSPTPGGSDPDAPAGDIAQALEQSVISDQISDLRSQVDSQLQASEGIEIITPALAEALVALFTSVLAQGCRRSDKELRNDILVVINLMLRAPGFSAACVPAGLFEAVVAVSVAPELITGAPLVNNAALTTEECDMELRLLCWQTASLGCKLEAAALTAATNIGFVGVLLLHMDLGAESSPSIRRWNSDQLATLRTAAISRLYEVAPLCPEQYISAGGFGIMLAFLTASLQAVGGGGLGPSKGHILGALRHMHRLCVAVPAACETLGAQGAIPMLIDLVRQAPQASPKPDGGIRHLSLLLLSALCSCPPMEGSNTSNIRRFRQEGGVQVLVEQLKVLHQSDPTLPSTYAVALLDAIWKCVVPDRKSTARFLVDEGLDILLQVLEVGNRDHRPITVSLLADLLVNPKSHSFFHDWRSDLDKKSAANMLLAIWKEEDALRGMTSKQGFLSNTSRPLTGKGTRERWVPSDTLAYGNLDPKRRDGMQLIKDACSGDKLLEKLYAVFKVVGLDTMSYLSTHDQCTLVMVEKYVKFRQGEMWRELDLEFEQEGMRPTSPDRVRLDSGIELAEHIARAVVDAQSQILGKYTATIRSQEQKHLDSMLAQRKYEQEMRFYQKDRSQLTLAELREAKRKKEEMLKNSIKSFAVLDDEV